MTSPRTAAVTTEPADAPLDAGVSQSLAPRGLEARRLESTDRAGADRWLDAVSRGFLDGERNDAQRGAFFERSAGRRRIGVYDPTGPSPDVPVATLSSWRSDLTTPGDSVPSWAISAVTVAPTHRRRGILRALLSSELQTASTAGYPVASLTVSESSIYGRFGFAPAAFSASVEIDVRRAGWTGPEPEGRVDFLPRAEAEHVVSDLHERVRGDLPGEVDRGRGDWARMLGLSVDAENPERIRVAQFRSPAGVVDGVVVYSVTENAKDFAASSVSVIHLLAATDDAYAALWRFLLTMDLISTVRANELSVDEPLWWMLSDRRAATVRVRDHHYLRVLHPAAALAARRYDVEDDVVLDVDDPLGFATGRFRLSTDAEGRARVTAASARDESASLTRLGVAELSAILLGGVSPRTLERAGRLKSDDAAGLGRLFASGVAPRLSFWY